MSHPIHALSKTLRSSLKRVNKEIKDNIKDEEKLITATAGHLLNSDGKKIRPLLTLIISRMLKYRGNADVTLAVCIEFIHNATLLHDDVIDNGEIRRGKKTLNKIWGNQSSILVGDYLLSRCFEMMVEDGNLEILKLLSSTSTEIAQGEVLQLQHKGEIDMLEETYLKIISEKTASLFAAATKVGSILANKENKIKEALEFYGKNLGCLLYTSPSPRDRTRSRMPSSA